MKKVLYISAGSKIWGIGHLRRSAEVISELQKTGVDVYAVALVPDDLDARTLKPFLAPYHTRVSTLDEINPDGMTAVVVDVHDSLQPDMFSWLKQSSSRVFALDWYLNDQGVVGQKINLREGIAAFPYCIIRKEFHEARRKCAGTSPRYDAVAVVGGGDLRGHLTKLMTCFMKDPFYCNRKIVVVVGPTASVLPPGGSFLRHLQILQSPDRLAEIMAGAYVGISNGGSSLMEFTMLGIPTLVFPQATQEDLFVRPFIKNGSSIHGSVDENVFRNQLKEVWENTLSRNQMSHRAQQLIDGFGARRIADKIVNFLENRQ